MTTSSTPNSADATSIFGSCFFAKSTTTKAIFDACNPSDLSCLDISGYTIVSGCDTCIGTTTSTTQPVTTTSTTVPVTTTSTTADPYNYYFMRTCPPSSTDIVVRTTGTLTIGNNETDSSTVSIFGTCYYAYNTATKVQYDTNAGDAPSQDVSSLTVYANCSECQGGGTTTTTQPVTTTTTQAPITVYEKTITADEDSGFGNETTPAATAKTELCFDIMPFSAWSESDNLATAIQVGQVWYANAAGTNPFSGAFKWYGVGTTEDLGALYVIRLSDAGIVTETNTVC